VGTRAGRLASESVEPIDGHTVLDALAGLLGPGSSIGLILGSRLAVGIGVGVGIYSPTGVLSAW